MDIFHGISKIHLVHCASTYQQGIPVKSNHEHSEIHTISEMENLFLPKPTTNMLNTQLPHATILFSYMYATCMYADSHLNTFRTKEAPF